MIYRICKPCEGLEPAGRGPYAYNTELSNAVAHHNKCPFHPMPSNDGINHYKIAEEWGAEPYYAFQTLSALYAWFGDITDILIKYEFVIRVLDVELKPCYIGRSGQCIFDPSKARLVCDVNLGGDLAAIKKRVARKVKHANREYRRN